MSEKAGKMPVEDGGAPMDKGRERKNDFNHKFFFLFYLVFPVPFIVI
jgi:hypothetical protein